MSKISRRALAALLASLVTGLALLPTAASADALTEIHIDWATYNPVSIILKQGWAIC